MRDETRSKYHVNSKDDKIWEEEIGWGFINVNSITYKNNGYKQNIYSETKQKNSILLLS